MSKTNVNLMISMVETEAESLLRSYPDYPYQQAFTMPRLRQKLVAYVLSRIPNFYAVSEEQEFHKEEPLYCPREQRQQIETLIHCGIQYLLTETLPQIAIDAEAYEDMEAMNVGSTSSHWY